MAPISMTVSAPMWRNDLDVPGDHSSRPERFSHGGAGGAPSRAWTSCAVKSEVTLMTNCAIAEALIGLRAFVLVVEAGSSISSRRVCNCGFSIARHAASR
jgi:hypothetical protein